MESKKSNGPSSLKRRIVLHADLNSFFATAEQQANPALRGKPVGVVKARGRSCIIAASVEAKKYGVGTGSRTYDAKKLCPDIVLVPADFAKYEYISRKFIEICSSYSPLCEVFSLDECFIDVTETEKFWGNVFNIAFEIKRRLREEVGDYLTCSVGISHNRLLSKLASEQIKPDGLFWITEDNMLEVLDRSKLMNVCGLGWGLYNHLISLGIDSFSKLRAQPFSYLYKHFGPHWSIHLYNISRGADNSSLVSIEKIPEAKSVGRTYTTHRVLNSKAEIYKVVRNLCEETAEKAREMNLSGRYVAFFLRTSPRYWSGKQQNGGKTKSWYGHRTLSSYISSGRELFGVCQQIAEGWQPENIIFCGVTLGMLAKAYWQPIPIFKEDRKYARLVSSVDTINKRFGHYTVFPGQLLGMPIVMPEVTGFFGDRKYRLDKFFNK
jgi:DNA polymerase-4